MVLRACAFQASDRHLPKVQTFTPDSTESAVRLWDTNRSCLVGHLCKDKDAGDGPKRRDPIIILRGSDADSGIFHTNQNDYSDRLVSYGPEFAMGELRNSLEIRESKSYRRHQSYIEEYGEAKLHHRTQRRLRQI